MWPFGNHGVAELCEWRMSQGMHFLMMRPPRVDLVRLLHYKCPERPRADSPTCGVAAGIQNQIIFKSSHLLFLLSLGRGAVREQAFQRGLPPSKALLHKKKLLNGRPSSVKPGTGKPGPLKPFPKKALAGPKLAFRSPNAPQRPRQQPPLPEGDTWWCLIDVLGMHSFDVRHFLTSVRPPDSLVKCGLHRAGTPSPPGSMIECDLHPCFLYLLLLCLFVGVGAMRGWFNVCADAKVVKCSCSHSALLLLKACEGFVLPHVLLDPHPCFPKLPETEKGGGTFQSAANLRILALKF